MTTYSAVVTTGIYCRPGCAAMPLRQNVQTIDHPAADLTVLDIAFAAGFGSLRQFNRTMREVFRASPTDLRHRRHRADRLAADGGLTLRLPVVPG